MIPWVGDIVRIKHHNHSPFSALSSIVGDIIVQESYFRIGTNLVKVVIGGFEVDIQIPRGNVYSSVLTVGPLFKLIKPVTDFHDIRAGSFDPVPVPGDMIQFTGREKYTIAACDCSKDVNHWPYGRMSCGAHMLGVESIAYNARGGWLHDGVLSRNIMTFTSWTTTTLKNANTSPSSTLCVACGGLLKDIGMGPSYKHCPKCEP